MTTDIIKETKKNKDSINLKNFEENIKRLEEIASNLENNNLNLEQAFKEFTEGSEIAINANRQLTAVSEKVLTIIKNNKKEFNKKS